MDVRQMTSEEYCALAKTALEENLLDPEHPLWDDLRAFTAVCHQTAVEKDWWGKVARFAARHPDLMKDFLPEIIASKLMLSVSEHSEALEEVRVGGREDLFYTVTIDGRQRRFLDYDEAKRELGKHGRVEQLPKPEGFAVELADILIRVVDLAAYLGIDLAEVTRLKMIYNRSREIRHGGKVL